MKRYKSLFESENEISSEEIEKIRQDLYGDFFATNVWYRIDYKNIPMEIMHLSNGNKKLRKFRTPADVDYFSIKNNILHFENTPHQKGMNFFNTICYQIIDGKLKVEPKLNLLYQKIMKMEGIDRLDTWHEMFTKNLYDFYPKNPKANKHNELVKKAIEFMRA